MLHKRLTRDTQVVKGHMQETREGTRAFIPPHNRVSNMLDLCREVAGELGAKIGQLWRGKHREVVKHVAEIGRASCRERVLVAV